MTDNEELGRIATIPWSDATTRGLYAVESASLQRALEDIGTQSAAITGTPARLSVTPRSLAAFTGLRLGGGEPGPLERLVCSLDDELWFLGHAPGWAASGLLVPLGADPDDAAALTAGTPLSPELPGVSVLDGTRAPVWRAMLRSAARHYESADPSLVQWLSFIGDAGPNGVDRLVFSTLALFTAVVDFADNGHEILVASA